MSEERMSFRGIEEEERGEAHDDLQDRNRVLEFLSDKLECSCRASRDRLALIARLSRV